MKTPVLYARNYRSILFLFRADFDCFQVELAKNYGVNEWREDLRKVMMKAGLENNPTVFLFSDTQVTNVTILQFENEFLALINSFFRVSQNIF